MIVRLVAAVVIAISITVATQGTRVYAGGPEHDYDERFEDIPGAPECWYDGYRDGQDHPFNHERNEECKDKGNQYYAAFIHGCMSVEGNTREICENATDS